MKLRLLAPLAGLAVAATCLALPTTPAAATTPATYYVSTTGSDTAAGTLSAPWRTVKRGMQALYPGDTLYVRGGEYDEIDTSVYTRPATSTAPITVANYPGERPVLKGLLWLRGINYWTLNGINVTWDSTQASTSHMVKVTNGVGWTWKNSELWGAHSYAAMLVAGTVTGEPSNWSVTNNCLHDTYTSNSTNQDHLIYANTGTTSGPGLIAHNVMFNAFNGEAVKLGGATSTSGAGSNTTVRFNTMYNAVQPILIGWQSANNNVYGNLMGKTGTYYSTIRGYQLSGTGNVAHGNIGFASKGLILNDSGYQKVTDTGANTFPLDPQFDNVTSCTGFHPAVTAAQAVGAWSTAG